MKRQLVPRCRRRSASRSRIWACTDTSSADTASSSTRTSGSGASARAIDTRWRCPPDSVAGFRPATSGASPTRPRSRSTSACGPAPLRPAGSAPESAAPDPAPPEPAAFEPAESEPEERTESASRRIRSTLQRGSKELSGSCWTTEIRERRARRLRSGRADQSWPRRVTVPESADSRPSAIRAVVDFPDPDSPTIPRTSPRWSRKDTPSTARCTLPRRPRKVRVSSRASSTISVGVPTGP